VKISKARLMNINIIILKQLNNDEVYNVSRLKFLNKLISDFGDYYVERKRVV